MAFEDISFGKNFTEWQSASSFNMGWQYSFISRAGFYANIKSEYFNYMQRWVQNYLWWYDGWVPYFHKQNEGIFSTKIGAAIVNGAAKKVFGGQLFFKTRQKEELKKGEDGKYIVNKALSFISSEWCEKANFNTEVKKAIIFSAAAGTSLLKINKSGKDLYVSALRFDSFYPTVGFNGKLIDLYCFIRNFVSLKRDKDVCENYYVVEHRYFGEYKTVKGEIRKHCPLIAYEIRKNTGTITTGQNYGDGERIDFKSLPREVRSNVAKSFSGIEFDTPIPLPFADHLGAELINWTECVSALPELPFGESLLYNIMPYLQSYDYYWSAFNTDMYLGRGRVLLPKTMQSAKTDGYNSGLDSFTYTEVESLGEQIKPTPIQFDLRSQSWKDIRDMLIQNISINTGINLSSIASFLTDTNAARTAREISTEESETAAFVQDKRTLIEKPINRILRLVTTFYGYSDEIILRWSASGLSNIYSRADLINSARQSKTISLKKALQMFNQDADEYELQEEYDQIQEELKNENHQDISEFYPELTDSENKEEENDSEQTVELPSDNA